MLTQAYRPYASEMPPEVYEAYLASVLNTDEGRQLVAADDGEILGGARLYLPGDGRSSLPPDWAWVRAVAVHPSARGTGVGRALMAHVAAHAHPATALALHTMDSCPPPCGCTRVSATNASRNTTSSPAAATSPPSRTGSSSPPAERSRRDEIRREDLV